LDAQEFFLQTDLLSDLRMVYELANRYNTAIYAVDPRGLAPFEFDLSTAGQAAVGLTKNQQMLDTTMDTLRILADETDGRAILNTNDLDKGLRQIVRDSSAYYLLGYTSAVTTDGKFHKINVRVKRPGLQVRARPGYLALSAVEAERALAPKKAGPPPAITQALGTLAVYPNHGRWEASNTQVEGDRVLRYAKGEHDPALDHIDYGAMALRRSLLERYPAEQRFGLEQIQQETAAAGRLRALVATQRFYEVGSLQGIAELERYLRDGASCAR